MQTLVALRFPYAEIPMVMFESNLIFIVRSDVGYPGVLKLDAGCDAIGICDVIRQPLRRRPLWQ